MKASSCQRRSVLRVPWCFYDVCSPLHVPELPEGQPQPPPGLYSAITDGTKFQTRTIPDRMEDDDIVNITSPAGVFCSLSSRHGSGRQRVLDGSAVIQLSRSSRSSDFLRDTTSWSEENSSKRRPTLMPTTHVHAPRNTAIRGLCCSYTAQHCSLLRDKCTVQ